MQHAHLQGCPAHSLHALCPACPQLVQGLAAEAWRLWQSQWQQPWQEPEPLLQPPPPPPQQQQQQQWGPASGPSFAGPLLAAAAPSAVVPAALHALLLPGQPPLQQPLQQPGGAAVLCTLLEQPGLQVRSALLVAGQCAACSAGWALLPART